MRVIEVTEFGGPEVLTAREAPDAVAAEGQVVIEVSVADVLFVDTQIRRGLGREHFQVTPPYVPGSGVAGHVRAVGDGVDPAWVDRRVLAHTGNRQAHDGYAEQAVVPTDALVPVPDELDLREAAALMHDGTTALGLVEQAEIRPREWVLVLAAAGGLGILLVQLARAAEARVIGAARGQRKLDLIHELGGQAVNYAAPDWTQRVLDATGGTGPDVVFDGAGGGLGLAAFDITARGGRFSAHGGPSGGFAEIDRHEAERRRVRLQGIENVQYGPDDLKRLTAKALAEAAAGRIQPIIGQTFPLEKATDAHAAIEAREVVGKTLLETDSRRVSVPMLTQAERAYVRSQPLGRLATIGPDGAPYVKPVAFRFNAATNAIDVGGPALREARQFRNVGGDPRVSFVVDDIAAHAVGPGGQRGRGVELRGAAETLDDEPLMEGFTRDLIRIRPRRVVSWNLDAPGVHARDVTGSDGDPS